MKEKTLKLNMVINTIKSVMSIVFPLVTFPYVSRILGVENIGKYNFVNSIISFFSLIAGLGIGTYAIREGAAIRDNSIELKKFSNQMFTINLISTIFSYLLLGILVLAVTKLQSYLSLFIILSIQIIFKTIGIEWVYSIYENYIYITIKSIVFQLVSLILMIMLVNDKNDLEMYAIVTVIACVGSNIFNCFHIRKKIQIGLTRFLELKKHIKPILMLFAMELTVTVYVSSDTTILGFLCDDTTVGIYSVSVKIYSIVKSILGAILVVAIPRLSSLYGDNKLDEFKKTGQEIYKTLLTLIIPAMVGVMILRESIVRLIAGEQYLDACSSLLVLSVALMFCMAAWFWGQCILVPIKQEKEVFKITMISAILNILLNFILIPLWGEMAAAITTVIAELCSYLWCMYKGRKWTGISGFSNILFKIICGTVGMVAVSMLVRLFIGNYLMCFIVTILCAIVVYIVIEMALKNEVVYNIVVGKNK